MTLGELIGRFRVLADDLAVPHFWQQEWVVDWLNEAQQQASVRARLLREDVDQAVCRIALLPGQQTYRLHASVYELVHVRIQPASGRARGLRLLTRELLDAEHEGWRDDERPAWAAIQDDVSLRVVGRVAQGDVLHLECYRLPKAMADDDDEPEIHRAHHAHLLDWVLHRAFGVPDAEVFDAARSQQALQEFSRYFGGLPDADLRRMTRHDVVQHNRVHLP